MSMPANHIQPADRETLLKIARQALSAAVRGEKLMPLDDDLIPPKLKVPGASFVTLTKQGDLRGCIGSLEAKLPLAEDVRRHAVEAALEDFRFPPVQPEELDEISIEISCLTPPVQLEYGDADDLLKKIQPGVDGVIFQDGWHRATFLPQVWEKLPDPAEFFSHLCYKMGVSPNWWRIKKLDVQIYNVEEFHE